MKKINREPCFSIYTKDDCPYCVDAKIILDNLKVFYVEFNISNEVHKAKLVEKGLKTVPQIWYYPVGSLDGEHIGGKTDLEKWLKANQIGVTNGWHCNRPRT